MSFATDKFNYYIFDKGLIDLNVLWLILGFCAKQALLIEKKSLDSCALNRSLWQRRDR